MAVSLTREKDAPMGAMNTTPLIDVMLVLLIMFIITIPAATQSLDVDLPGIEKVRFTPSEVVNKVVVDARQNILWNGETVTEGQLAALLVATTKMAVEPELQFEPEALASYDRSARVMKIIKGAGVTNFGFVGNERYRSFDRAS